MAAAQEQRRLGAGIGPPFKVLTQGTAYRGVEGNITLLAPFAVAHAHSAGALAEFQVGEPQGA